MSLTVLRTNVLHCDDVYSLRVLYYEALDNHIGWDDYVIQNITGADMARQCVVVPSVGHKCVTDLI